jgi:hypothetical protein
MSALTPQTASGENRGELVYTLEQKEQETLPVVSYENYREFCDRTTDSFRRIGILEKAGYDEAIQDERTLFCTVEGHRVPALVPVEHEERYHAERSKELTGKENVLLLTLPLPLVREGALLDPHMLTGGELPADFAVLVEEPHAAIQGERELDHLFIARQLSMRGHLEPHEFVDDRVQDAENQTAAMSVYDFTIESDLEVPEAIEQLPEVEAFEQAWKSYREEKGFAEFPDETSNGTFLFTAEQLKDHPEIIDSLWAISEVGFGKVLGKNHPVSMEVTKAFFADHIQSHSVFTSVRYAEGEAFSFGFMAPNMEHNDWMDCDSTVLRQNLEAAGARGELTAHFFELISKGERGAGLSLSVVNLLLEVAARTGKKIHVLFESTNYSGEIMPGLTAMLVDRSKSVHMARQIEKLAQLDYWFMSTASTEASTEDQRLAA